MTNEEEIDIINKLIIRREIAKKAGNEAEADDIKKLFEKKGFEVDDNDKDIVTVKRKKIKESI